MEMNRVAILRDLVADNELGKKKFKWTNSVRFTAKLCMF